MVTSLSLFGQERLLALNKLLSEDPTPVVYGLVGALALIM